ncbi:MAG TPA: aminotransferase class V-fold PLP-dependent enzyme [Bacteroidia bacterium]|nr:aminotransferase class V-fold PLP-dependent enzyme [Bacteroidia bacterium]
MYPELQNEFLLKPGITFLNFGSFGACPKPVFEDYQNWQRLLEEEPVQFMTVKGLQYLEHSRKALGTFLNCQADDLVYVPNPTYAVNIIAKSLKLEAGDEVLSTDLEYGACDRTWAYYCKSMGAVYKRQPVKLPIVSKEDFIADFLKGISNKTKVIFISQITSSTALILPVKEIVDAARARGILAIVDGAHVPGHMALDIQDLDADIYTGACHKWMMAPKGCTFLYVRRELQSRFDPLVISWGYQSEKPSHSRFLDYHQMSGTRDFSAYLSVPASIEFMRKHNWPEVSARCKKMVLEQAPRFIELLNSPALAPLNQNFIGQMLSLELKCQSPELIKDTLYQEYQIEIPVMRHSEKVFIRYSLNAFNSSDDMDRLYTALSELQTKGLILNEP